MSVRIRLSRTGRKNLPLWRVAVFDQRTRRDGKYLENLGTYNPREKEDAKKMVLKTERLQYWLKHGAQVTDSLRSIFKSIGILLK